MPAVLSPPQPNEAGARVGDFPLLVETAPPGLVGRYFTTQRHVLGLIFGLMAATAISSVAFLFWTRKALIGAPEGTQNDGAAA